jgi:uncharacterized protein YjiS (DUF1127 family)
MSATASNPASSTISLSTLRHSSSKIIDAPSAHDESAALPLKDPIEAASPPQRAFERILMRFLAWRARLKTVRILNSIDNATLRDLGISDIESVVYGAPEGHKRNYDPDWWRKAKW